MRHRIWLQKDPNVAAPTRIDAKQERGFYVIFNVNQWRKERVSIPNLQPFLIFILILSYSGRFF
jgi:hypothetical protein